MNDERFDSFSRWLARGESRRQALKLLVSGAFGLTLTAKVQRAQADDLPIILNAIFGDAPGGPPAPSTDDTDYAPDMDTEPDTILKNPERGIFHNSLPTTTLYYHTLMPAYLYLDKDCGIDLIWDGPTASTTTQILKTFAAKKLKPARDAGLKVVFRPRYDTEADGNKPSTCKVDNTNVFHADSPLRQRNHIEAIAKMLADYRDVVAFVQAGYLGRWGEWNTSSPDPDNPIYDEKNAPFLYDNALRGEIIDYVLTTYAQYQIEQDVELRRPVFAYEVMERWQDLGLGMPNVGFHSDCYLSNSSDGGTYSALDIPPFKPGAPTLANPKTWAQQMLTPNASFGGETCNAGGNAAGGPEPWRDCDRMVSESAALRLNYLNGDYSDFAIDAWKDDQCFDDILLYIGYRFEVLRVGYPPTVSAGQSLQISVDIKNTGWAKLHKPRRAQLILRKGSEAPIVYENDVENGAVETWSPQETTTISVTAPPPAAGTYQLWLAIPDPNAKTYADYAVRLASKRADQKLFDEITGENNLGVAITVH